MNTEILNDFIKIGEVSESLIEKYKNILPEEVIELWKNYGFGTFMNGYLKVINPDDYKTLLEWSYFEGNTSFPIFTTAFGDIITWEKNEYVGIVMYRYGDFDIISQGFEFFYDIISDEEMAEEYINMDEYNKAIKIHGSLKYDECFGYVPLLALGGKEVPENLKKVKIREHIALITELTGGI
ncbi:MAG: DUF1851 domain-containing protein [Oscillospiraceae bacterium]|nr:DUF1851 domain-containing protein [Oscillospiraceae bacterium]